MKSGELNPTGRVFADFYSSASGSVDLGTLQKIYPIYYYTGTSATTWTLPTLSSLQNSMLFVMNRSLTLSATLTLSKASSDSSGVIDRGSSADQVSSFDLGRGDCAMMIGCPTKLRIVMIKDL